MEAFAGIVLIVASLIALIVANSFLYPWYHDFLSSKFYIGFNNFQLTKPLLLWINDGLMALFFLLIGLELKREIMEGQLSKLSQVILPGIAALGGVLVPVLIYIYFNHDNAQLLKGWAIPAATDIAFALGILALLGPRIPLSLKVFLMALAIFDDLFAIIIIALFYTSDLSALSLFLAFATIVLLMILNRFNVRHISVYLFFGALLWLFVLKSGVHATLAGVVLGFCIPLNLKKNIKISPLKYIEKKLHPWISYFVLPVFAFANAGVPLSGFTIEDLTHPLTLGIMLGLFLGKQIGVFTFSYTMIKLKLAKLPEDSSLWQLYGVSVLAGIGFTMSLFIGTLAFDQDYSDTSRAGILLGSLFSALLGYVFLRLSLKS